MIPISHTFSEECNCDYCETWRINVPKRKREKERQLSLGENNKELSTKKDSTIDYNLNHFQ